VKRSGPIQRKTPLRRTAPIRPSTPPEREGKPKARTVKIHAADSIFSLYIRTRDNWTCQRCGKAYEPKPGPALQTSHFIGRAIWATRWDPDNCDALCWGCHERWEALKATEYREWKISQLGQERFAALIERSKLPTRRTAAAKVAIRVYVRALLASLDGGPVPEIPACLPRPITAPKPAASRESPIASSSTGLSGGSSLR
jgi:hypothetical protein